MRALLRGSGVLETNVHDGHDVPGIVTAADLAMIGKFRDGAFDKLFDRHIGDYLRHSVTLAKGEQDSGADPGTKAFAAAMAEARVGELARLAGRTG